MKLKKAVDLCLKAGRVHLYDHVDGNGVVTQWLGDGSAIYPLGGIPYLDEDTFCAVFDVPERKREKLLITKTDMPGNISVADYIAEDRGLEKLDISISYGGASVFPFLTRPCGGVVYIQKKYLAPLEDIEDELQFCERVDARGQRYIVVMAGLLISAVIMPYDMAKEGFCAKLDLLSRLTEDEMKKKHRAETPEGTGEDGTEAET